MSTQNWLGNAAPVAQLTVLTPASPSANDTFTVTCNSKAVSYQTAAGTVADVCNGVANAIANSSFAEFKEFQATNTGSTIQLAGHRRPACRLPSSTSVTTSGSATFMQSTPTAATGPNDWGNAANWSAGGGAPANGDNVYVADRDGPHPLRPGPVGRDSVEPECLAGVHGNDWLADLQRAGVIANTARWSCKSAHDRQYRHRLVGQRVGPHEAQHGDGDDDAQRAQYGAAARRGEPGFHLARLQLEQRGQPGEDDDGHRLFPRRHGPARHAAHRLRLQPEQRCDAHRRRGAHARHARHERRHGHAQQRRDDGHLSRPASSP